MRGRAAVDSRYSGVTAKGAARCSDAISNQRASCLERRVQPFMRIEGQEIGFLDARRPDRRCCGASRDESAPMQPSTWSQRSFFSREDRPEPCDIVDRARVHGAGRSRSRRPVEVQPARSCAIAECRSAQGPAAIRRPSGRGEGPVSQPKRLNCFAMASCEADQTRRTPAVFRSPRRRVLGRRSPALTLRATVRPMILAIEPPLTNVPLADVGKPMISLHQFDHLLVHQRAAA